MSQEGFVPSCLKNIDFHITAPESGITMGKKSAGL